MCVKFLVQYQLRGKVLNKDCPLSIYYLFFVVGHYAKAKEGSDYINAVLSFSEVAKRIVQNCFYFEKEIVSERMAREIVFRKKISSCVFVTKQIKKKINELNIQFM